MRDEMEDELRLKELDTRNFLINRLRRRPYLAAGGIMAWLRGLYYKLKFRVLFKRVKIGKYFRVYGKFYIMGPGRVVIGDNVMIQSLLIKPICFSTDQPGAEIHIGDHSTFSGTTISCSERVTIGDMCCIADAYITDSPNHFMAKDRRLRLDQEPESRPVSIEDNVWISVRATVLHGVTIGRNSVIGACSLVLDDVPPNSFAAGIPLRVIRTIQ
ncbi:MAG: acyltransferase [Deltaproteobacteria bacterium]|nr:acyltransferase [Deltaproteobacteria bacterium]